MPAACASVEKRAFSAGEGRAVIDRPGVRLVRQIISSRWLAQGLSYGRAGQALEGPEARVGVGRLGASYAIVLSLERDWWWLLPE